MLVAAVPVPEDAARVLRDTMLVNLSGECMTIKGLNGGLLRNLVRVLDADPSSVLLLCLGSTNVKVERLLKVDINF